MSDYHLPAKENERENPCCTVGWMAEPDDHDWQERTVPCYGIPACVRCGKSVANYTGLTRAVAVRTSRNTSVSQMICTPYDPEAASLRSASTTWEGYKVHSLNGDPAQPRLITHVETTVATTQDNVMTPDPPGLK